MCFFIALCAAFASTVVADFPRVTDGVGNGCCVDNAGATIEHYGTHPFRVASIRECKDYCRTDPACGAVNTVRQPGVAWEVSTFECRLLAWGPRPKDNTDDGDSNCRCFRLEGDEAITPQLWGHPDGNGDGFNRVDADGDGSCAADNEQQLTGYGGLPEPTSVNACKDACAADTSCAAFTMNAEPNLNVPGKFLAGSCTFHPWTLEASKTIPASNRRCFRKARLVAPRRQDVAVLPGDMPLVQNGYSQDGACVDSSGQPLIAITQTTGAHTVRDCRDACLNTVNCGAVNFFRNGPPASSNVCQMLSFSKEATGVDTSKTNARCYQRRRLSPSPLTGAAGAAATSGTSATVVAVATVVVGVVATSLMALQWRLRLHGDNNAGEVPERCVENPVYGAPFDCNAEATYAM